VIFAPQLAGVSESADVQLTVRLVATDGSKLGESTPIALAWAKTKLTGGLYYWTTAGTGDHDVQHGRRALRLRGRYLEPVDLSREQRCADPCRVVRPMHRLSRRVARWHADVVLARR